MSGPTPAEVLLNAAGAAVSGLEDVAGGRQTCIKCHRTSGDDWQQCGGKCPVACSPYFDPKTLKIYEHGGNEETEVLRLLLVHDAVMLVMSYAGGRLADEHRVLRSLIEALDAHRNPPRVETPYDGDIPF